MVRVKITPRKRKKRVRFLDKVQADSSRPRASYTPPPTTDADILKFIHKKAASQRRAKVNRMAGVAFGQQALRAYTAAQKKQRRRAGRHIPMPQKKPPKQKTCMTLMELARAFPNIAQQVCFHPKQSTFNSLVGRVPRSKQKVDQWLQKDPAPAWTSIVFIMSEIKRLTLISDPTDEFPNNANNSFKVRLPERLTLPGAGWHASLMSLAVPDQGQSNAVIVTDPHTKVIRFKFTEVIRWYQLGSYRRVETPAIDAQIELEEIMNANQIVATGSMFWNRVMQEVHKQNHVHCGDQTTSVVGFYTRRTTCGQRQEKRDAPTDMERRYLDDSCPGQKGCVEREQRRHD